VLSRSGAVMSVAQQGCWVGCGHQAPDRVESGLLCQFPGQQVRTVVRLRGHSVTLQQLPGRLAVVDAGWGSYTG